MAEVRVDMVAFDIAFRHRDEPPHHLLGTRAQLPEGDGGRRPHLKAVVGEPVDQGRTRHLSGRRHSAGMIRSAGPCLAQVSHRHRTNLPGRIGDRGRDHRQRILHCRAIAAAGDLAESCEGVHTGQHRLRLIRNDRREN